MASLTGHGRKNADLQLRTLRCDDTVVIDKDCNAKFASTKTTSLRVREDAVICGDLEVKGNIVGNVAGGGGSSTTKYQFSTCFHAGGNPAAERISVDEASTLNWNSANPFDTNGHMFNGPAGVPYDLTLLLVGDFVLVPSFDCQIVVQELSQTQFNSSFTGPVNTLVAMPVNTTADNVILSATVTPTITPAYWYYYCSNGAPQGPTTSLRSVHLVEQ